MARVFFPKTFTNSPAAPPHDASLTYKVWAEDILPLLSAIQNAMAGINTEQIEVGGTLFANAARQVTATQGTFTGLSVSNGRITDVASPTADTDAANKNYVDNNGGRLWSTYPALQNPDIAGYILQNVKGVNDIKFAEEFENGSSTGGIQEAHNALPSTGGTIILKAGTINISQTVVLSKQVRIIGQGKGTVVSKELNGDCFRCNNGASNIEIAYFQVYPNFESRGDGNPAPLYTTGNFITFNYSLQDPYIHDIYVHGKFGSGYFVDFQSFPCPRALIKNVVCKPGEALDDKYVIRCPSNTTVSDHTYDSIYTISGRLCDVSNGTENIFIHACNFSGIKFGATSAKVSVVASRWVSALLPNGNQSIQGFQHIIIGNMFSGLFSLDGDCRGNVIVGNLAPGGFVDNSSNPQRNVIIGHGKNDNIYRELLLTGLGHLGGGEGTSSQVAVFYSATGLPKGLKPASTGSAKLFYIPVPASKFDLLENFTVRGYLASTSDTLTVKLYKTDGATIANVNIEPTLLGSFTQSGGGYVNATTSVNHAKVTSDAEHYYFVVEMTAGASTNNCIFSHIVLREAVRFGNFSV